MSEQSIEKKVDGSLSMLRVQEWGHRCSWHRWGDDGSATLEVRTHEKARHVSLSMSECSKDGPRRITMMTLEEAGGKALYEQLHALYGTKQGV